MKKSFIASIKLYTLFFFSFFLTSLWAQTKNFSAQDAALAHQKGFSPSKFAKDSGSTHFEENIKSPSVITKSVSKGNLSCETGKTPIENDVQKAPGRVRDIPEEVYNALYKGDGLYSHFRPEDEAVELRSNNTKHFKNPDGTNTAIVGAGNLHYREEGVWKEILSHIFQNNTKEYVDYKFASTHNQHKIYFPENPGKSIVTKLKEEIYQDWGLPTMVWMDANAKILSEVNLNSSSKGIPSMDSLVYHDIFPSVDAVIINSTTTKKLNYVLKDSAFFTNKPAGAVFLAFRENIKTGIHWTMSGNKSTEKIYPPSSNGLFQDMLFLNGEKAAAIEIKTPIFYEFQPQQTSGGCSTDSLPPDTTAHYAGSFLLKQNLSEYEVYTLVPVQWLTHTERNFPVIIDPTTNYYPGGTWPTYTSYRSNNSGNWACATGNYGGRVYPNSDISYGWVDDTWPTNNPFLDGYATFNISALQDIACLVSVQYNWYHYAARNCGTDVTLKFGMAQFNANLAEEPDCNVTGIRTRNNNSYFSNTTKNGNGWQSQAGSIVDFGLALPGDQITLGWAYNCEGGDCDGDCCSSLCGGNDGNYHHVYGYESATNKPYAAVTYNLASIAASSATVSTNPTCPSQSTTLSVVGGSLGTGATWDWYSGSCGGTFVGSGSSISVSPAVTTTYYVRAVGTCNTTGCVSVTVNVSYTNSSPPTGASASINPTCPSQATSLLVSGGSLGTGANWQWYSGSCGGTYIGGGSPSVSPATTTTYWVRAEGTCNTTACQSVTITVNSNSTAPSGASASVNPTCGGATTLSQSGGFLGTGASYNWYSGSCGGTFVGTGSPSVTPASTTVYYVQAIGTCNTTACANVTVIVNTNSSAPTGASASINPTCPSQATLLTSSGGTLGTGANYQWYSGSCGGTYVGSGTPSVSPSTTTTYYVRAEGTCNNTACTSVTVNVNTNSTDPVSATASINPTCPGNATTLNVGGGSLGTGASWNWYSGSCGGTAVGTGPSISVSPATTTTYYVRAQGTCNTSNCAIVTVNVNTLSVAPAGANASVNPTCSGNATTVGVSGGFLGTGASWNWFSGSCGGTAEGSGSSINVSPTSTTTYFVYAQGTCNTTSCASVSLTVNPLPAAFTGADPTICENSGIIIGGAAVGGNTYSWAPSTGLSSAAVSDPLASPTTTSTYILTETITATGCFNSNSVTVNVNPVPAANTGSNQTICNGQNVQIGALPVAGNTYSWSPPTNLDNATISNPTANPPSTTTYTLTETITATGCQNSNSVTVGINLLPAAFTGSDQTICDGQVISIGGSPVGGNIYSWSPATSLSNPNIANPNSNPSSSITYTLTETVVATGCQNSNSVLVNVNPVPSAITGGNQTICFGQSIVIGAAPVGGNTYSWSPSTDLDNANISNPTATPPGTVTYSLTETITSTGCQKTNSAIITVNPLPAANAGLDQTICNGQVIIIGTVPVGGNSYNWSPATGLSSSTVSNPSANPADTTTYTLTETIIATGCQNSNSVTVIVNPLPAAVTGADQTICENSGIQIGATAIGGNTYSWAPSSGLSSTTVSDPMASPVSTSIYTLTETIVATGCTNSNSVTVNVNPAPAANVGSNQVICNGQNVQIGAPPVGGNTYSWVPGTALDNSAIADPISNPASTTTYFLTETITATGCQKTDSVVVTVNPLPVVTFSGLASSYCIDAVPATLTGSPFGGTFTGTGISGNSFDPVLAGIGGPYSVNYSFTDGNTCTNDTSISTMVYDLPLVTFDGFSGPYCANIITPVPLNGNPGGGTFSGPGISGDDFYPNIANVGNNVITYYFTDGNSCSNTFTDSVTVIGVPYASFMGLGSSYCEDDTNLVTLTGTPTGGTFSGNGISGNTFSPAAAGVGNQTITYTYTDGNGCTNSQNQSATVNSLPAITFSGLDTSYCVNGISVSLNGFPSGGIFSGNGISGNTFSPSTAGIGTHPIIYSYTSGTGCSNDTTISTNVYDAPVVSFTGLAPGYCFNNSAVTLTGTPAGGSFSGTGISGNSFFPSIAGVGTHPVTYTYSDGFNCTNSQTQPVDVFAAPIVTFSGLSGPYCANEAPVTLSGNPAGGVFSGNGISGNDFDPTIAGAGTHSIKYLYSDGNGCSDSASQNVIVNPVPVVDFSGLDSAYCDNNSSESLTGFPSGGTFTGNGISGNTFDPSASGNGNQAITYTFTDANGCTNNIIKNTMVNSAPVATITPGGSTVFCQGDSVSLTASAGVSYSWSTGAVLQSITVSSSGNFSVTVTNGSNCSSNASISVNANSNPLLSVTSITNASCNGGNNGSATVTASGGAFPYSFLWDNNAGNQTSPLATGLNAGTYFVSVSDMNSCSSSISATINNPPGLIATTSSVNSCIGGNIGSATVIPSGGTWPYSFLWDILAGNQTTSTATGLSAGTYSVTVTDTNACTFVTSAVVNENTTVFLSSSSNSNCVGGSIGSATVLPGGGTSPYSYLWDSNSGNQNTPTATGLAGGIYSVTVSDSNSCLTTLSVNISDVQMVTSSVSSSSACVGGNTGTATVSASGGTSPYSYSWDINTGNQFTQTATGLTAGIYSVTISDLNICTQSATVTVDSSNALFLTSSTSTTCFGGSTGSATVIPSGGTNPYSFLWDSNASGQTSQTATGLGTGNYFVTVSDSNSCTSFTSLNVSSSISLVFTSSSSPSCIGGTTGTATISPSGGAPPYSFLWDTNAGNQTSPTATGLDSGTYSVTISDANACSATASVTISSVPGVSLSVSGNGGCGGGNSGTATVVVSGGTVPYYFLWDANTGSQATPIATGLASGIYNVSVSDLNGCSSSGNATVVVPSALSTAVSNTDVPCNGGNNATATISVSGGISPYVFQWSDGQVTSTANNLSAGNYFVVVTDSNLCTDTSYVSINQPAPIILSGSSVQAVCGANNGSATVNAAGGTIPYSFQWDSNTGNQSSTTATGLGVGIYSVTVSDANSCSNTLSVIVNGTSSLNLGITATNILCNGANDGTAVVVANGGTTPYSYLWSDGQTTQAATGLPPGNYSVTVTNADGCSAADTISVTQPPPIIAGISNDTTICAGDTVLLTATGGTNYLWTSGQNTPAIAVSPPATSVFSVGVFDGTGCMVSLSVNVYVIPFVNAGISGNASVCMGQTVTLTAGDGTDYLWSTGETNTSIDVSPPFSSVYYVTSTNSCFSDTASFLVSVSYISASFSEDTTILIGTNAQLWAIGGAAYNWDPPTNLTCYDCPNPLADPNSTTTYYVTVTDAAGCNATDTIEITVDDSKTVFVPNIFSPNHDNANDYVYVFGKGLVWAEISIFDRWGTKVYEYQGAIPQMGGKGGPEWDGISPKGSPYNTSVFVYHLKVVFYDGEVQNIEGNITLVR